MKSVQKRAKLGVYLSLLGSVSIMIVLAIWNFSYLSNLYAIQDRWNEQIALRLTKMALWAPSDHKFNRM